MAFDVEAAKAAGYSQEEIDAYLQAKPQTKVQAPVAPGQEVDPGEPPPPPPAEGYQQAGEGSFLPAVGTAVAAAAPYALPAAGTAAGIYGAAKVGGWGREMANAAKDVAGAMKERTAVEAAREARMAMRPGFGGVPAGGAPAPAAAPAPVAPAAPAAAPAPAPTPAAQQPGIMQRGMDYARQMQKIAADKVMQNASTIGKVGIGAAAALTPGNVGQRYPFPTSGRFAGMEINPRTGRPWTPQEIAQVQ